MRLQRLKESKMSLVFIASIMLIYYYYFFLSFHLKFRLFKHKDDAGRTVPPVGYSAVEHLKKKKPSEKK